MEDVSRRDMLRVTAPAVAMPLMTMTDASAMAAQTDLVTKEEIKAAMRVYAHQRLTANMMNDRLEFIIDMLFNANVDVLRRRISDMHEQTARAEYWLGAGLVGSREDFKAKNGYYPEDGDKLVIEDKPGGASPTG